MKVNVKVVGDVNNPHFRAVEDSLMKVLGATSPSDKVKIEIIDKKQNPLKSYGVKNPNMVDPERMRELFGK